MALGWIGCEQQTQSGRHLEDAAIDSGRDARVPQPDARVPQPQQKDAGGLVESAQCGFSEQAVVAVFSGTERILPDKIMTIESAVSQATVTSIDRGNLDQRVTAPARSVRRQHRAVRRRTRSIVRVRSPRR
jgi:hypothetical protein